MDKHRECIEQGHCRPRHQSKKDCASWCKGRVGVEHDWEWRPVIDAADGARFGTFLDGRVRFRNEGDEHGWAVERQHCLCCGRRGATRKRCHCGELLTPLKTGSRWRYDRFESHCAACGYTCSWPQIYVRCERESWIDAPGRPVHQCAIVPQMHPLTLGAVLRGVR